MKGIDIAKWNKVTNYRSVKNSGVQFAIVKVINSSNKPDSRFHEHVSGLNSAGIPITGGYTYSYANTVDKAKKAADAFVETAKPKNINVMWLDLEDNAVKGLGSSIIDIINTYKMFAESANMDFGIYTGAAYYNPYLRPYRKEIADIPIWWARYPYTKERTITADVPDSRYLPAGIELTGWQYSSKGVIPGIQGYTDLNIWYKKEQFENVAKEIPVEYNPFTEPAANVKLGTTGNDARWVQWYLWRFGLIQKNEIDGIIGRKSGVGIEEAQRRLGLPQDAIVGLVTRSVWKKVC